MIISISSNFAVLGRILFFKQCKDWNFNPLLKILLFQSITAMDKFYTDPAVFLAIQKHCLISISLKKY